MREGRIPYFVDRGVEATLRFSGEHLGGDAR